MEIGIQTAAKKYGVSQQALLDAIRRGVLPAMTVPVLEIRLKPKDIQAYVATIPAWRRAAGKRGAATRWARYRAARGAGSAPLQPA